MVSLCRRIKIRSLVLCLSWLLFLSKSFYVQASGIQSLDTMKVEELRGTDHRSRFIAENFRQMPEKKISINEQLRVNAQYADPTLQYSHGILGDAVEGKRLVVVRDQTVHSLVLSKDYVFEDIQPRLVDIDNDGELEIVTIRTHVDKGAGIMIYKVVDEKLTEFAWVNEIGSPNRWLNIAAIYDLDGDGTNELAWIETPHIGGTLKIAKFQPGELKFVAHVSLYSNHAIGERNLCLSVVEQRTNAVILFVPTQDRRQITGFQFRGNSIVKTESINIGVNFSSPLSSQHRFKNIVQENNGCDHLDVN